MVFIFLKISRMEYTKINPKPMINEELTYIDEIPNTAVGFT